MEMEPSSPASDEALIRRLKDEEERGWCTGDVDLILSCYAPSFVSYHAHGSGDASTWTLLDPDIEAFRSRLEELDLQDQGWSPECREHVFEHLQIHGNAAFAVTAHARRGGMSSHRSIWIFKKTDGRWEITSFIIHVSGERLSLVQGGFPKGLLLIAGGMLLGLGLGYYLGKKD
jgi:hypothetical protein